MEGPEQAPQAPPIDPDATLSPDWATAFARKHRRPAPARAGAPARPRLSRWAASRIRRGLPLAYRPGEASRRRPRTDSPVRLPKPAIAAIITRAIRPRGHRSPSARPATRVARPPDDPLPADEPPPAPDRGPA